MNHAVLLKIPPIENLEAIASALAQIERINVFDARTQVRRGWGFVENQATPERAQHLVTQLNERGIESFALPCADLLKLSEPQKMHGFRMDPEGLTPEGEGGRELGLPIPWKELMIVAAAGFHKEVIRKEAGGNSDHSKAQMVGLGIFLFTGMPVGIFGGKKKQEESPESRSHEFIKFAQLITTSGKSFVFKPSSFNFTGLGPLKQLNMSLNFQVMVSELLKLSSAMPNLGARLLQDKKPLSAANYAGIRDFETELRWMVNVAKFHRRS